VALDQTVKTVSPRSAPLRRAEVVALEPWGGAAAGGTPEGFDARSRYVERFWLPVLGPTATWLVRRLADLLEDDTEGARLDLAETARSFGLEWSGGDHSPLRRGLGRCVNYGLARWSGPELLAVRTRMPVVWRRLLLRLPETLQAEHRDWLAETAVSDPSARRRRQAKLVALDLAELGVDDAGIERHLLRRGVHPAVAFEAARWAWSNKEEGLAD
jgi:hypothetical protein